MMMMKTFIVMVMVVVKMLLLLMTTTTTMMMIVFKDTTTVDECELPTLKTTFAVFLEVQNGSQTDTESDSTLLLSVCYCLWFLSLCQPSSPSVSHVTVW